MTKQRRVAVATQLDLPYPQHQEVFLGVQRYAHEHSDWHCLVDEHPGYRRRGRNAMFQRYDGAVGRLSPPARRRLRRLGIPLVSTWFEHARPGLPGVYHDLARLGQMAAEHLIDRGFRRVYLLANYEQKTGSEVARAFAERCEQAGVSCELPRVPHGPFEEADNWLQIERALTAWSDTLTPPLGVCLQEPAMSRLLISFCEARGWDVPREVGIVSLNDNRAIAELSPKITCIDNNYELVGYEAAALLDRLMDGQPAPEEPILIPPRGVIARQSTDYFAVEDEAVAAALQYISGRLGERLGVEAIARAINVSPRNLQLRFQAALGRPISDEIRRLRLTTARRMLGDKERQIGEIARQTGFGNATVMSQVFRRELGMNPSAYRKQVLGIRAGGGC